MKISLDWLKDFIEHDLSPAQLMDTLNDIGLNIERWSDTEQGIVLDVIPQINRPDTLGHLGIARELGAKLGLPLKEKDWSALEGDDFTSETVDVQVWEEILCPRYSGIVVKGITLGPSEEWLQARLHSAGLKPINNVVDAANYVLCATGHPLHIYDLEKIRGARIIVRRAKKTESLICLDGRELLLETDDLVIADESSPMALAGILGGKSSAVSDTTQSVFIESACFDPASIYLTSQKHGLFTEASQRFEKGVDVTFTPQAARMAASLIFRSGGRTTKDLLDIYPNPDTPKTLMFRRRRIEELLGTEVTAEYIETLFERLGFKADKQQPDVWQVRIPPFRGDIAKETDLVEEIGRFHGYDRIPSRIHPVSTFSPKTDSEGEKRDGLRQILFHHGLDEIVNFGLVDGEAQAHFHSERNPVSLRNPTSSKLAELRTTLLPEMLISLSRNVNRGADGVHFFEIGNIHFQESEIFEERLSLGLVSTGRLGFPHWQEKPRQTDFYFIKGACESVMSHLGYRAFSFKSNGQNGCDEETCLSLWFKGQKLGFLGRLSKKVCDYFSIRDPAWAAELDLSLLFEKQQERFSLKPKTKFPSVSRDVSFILEVDIPYQIIERAIEKLNLSYLESYALVDRFTGKPFPKNKASLSFRFVFRHPRKTLLTDEVDGYLKTIIDKLGAQFEFELREGG